MTNSIGNGIRYLLYRPDTEIHTDLQGNSYGTRIKRKLAPAFLIKGWEKIEGPSIKMRTVMTCPPTKELSIKRKKTHS